MGGTNGSGAVTNRQLYDEIGKIHTKIDGLRKDFSDHRVEEERLSSTHVTRKECAKEMSIRDEDIKETNAMRNRIIGGAIVLGFVAALIGGPVGSAIAKAVEGLIK